MWRKKKKNNQKKQEQDFSQDIFEGIDPKILNGSFGMEGLENLDQINDLDQFNEGYFDDEDLEGDEDLLEELAILEGKKPVRQTNKQQVRKRKKPIKKTKQQQKNPQLQQKQKQSQQQILSLEEINKNVLELQQGSDSDNIEFDEDDLQDPELLRELEMMNGGNKARENPQKHQGVQSKPKTKQKPKLKTKTKTHKHQERIATIKELENIKVEWAKATMHYKQLQEEQKMVVMATGFRNLKALIERAKKGEKILLDDVPRPNQSKKKQKPNKQRKMQDSSDEGFEEIGETQKKTTTKKHKKKKKETKEEMNDRLYSEIESEIEKEIESLTKLEKAKLQAQDQKGANEMTNKIKLLRKQLNMLQVQKLNKKSPPEFQYETSTLQQEFVNSHLTEDEIEIVIVGGYDVRGNSPETLVEIIFPYPSSKPQKAETKPVKGNNPKYNFATKFKISRKKTFFTFIQKKKIKFCLFEKGSWFKSNKAVGRVDIIPQELFTKSEAHYRVDLLNKRKKPIGSQIEIIIRLRFPCQGKDIRNITHRSIIINDYLENLGLKPKSKKPSSKQSKSSKSNKKNEKSSNKTESHKGRGKEKDKVQGKGERKEKGTKTTTTTRTSTKTSTSKTNTKTKQSFDPNYGNPDVIEHIISNDVLQDIIKDCDSKIEEYKQQKKKIPEIILEKKEFAEQKINFLGQMVGSGKLSLEQYISQLKKEVVNEKQIATNLAKMKKMEWAKASLRRKKIMEKEIESAESIESESGDDEDEDEDDEIDEKKEEIKNEQKKTPINKSITQEKKQEKAKVTNTKSKQNFDPNYGNPDVIEHVISNDVLQDIIKDCDSKIEEYKQQKKKIPEIILEKKEFAEQKN
ncbi:coiled-coil and c2 domain-containing protein 1-like [Anaeramoeba flamelloides]|uniref:Coiled-coil and c2 domain-containing protein 1-like n=1 Tax=Anaeramoeba flamelloides TaxID=1746091 RepID=A0AAV7Z666_9EUKA|nr:coiled-coil and c2 domain-containing protein 1-like [Anaeramoeba flamelloides]